MINTFNFARTPQVYFGPGKVSLLPELLKKESAGILILTGASSFISQPLWAQLQQKFDDDKIKFYHFIIDKEPSVSMIDVCSEKYRGIEIKAVVAIGGGSVMDAGKAIAAMLRETGSVKDYLEGVGNKLPNGNKTAFIAIPTTSGTGSEATKNAVISEVGPNGFKKSLRHDNYVPDITIIDPELTITCLPSTTAFSGMDAFTQLLESYLSTNANIMTDSLAIKALELVSKSLIPAYINGHDLEARSDMAYASYVSGITLANAGLGVVHGFASSIGGFYDIPHGVICSSLMYMANMVTVRKLRKAGTYETTLHKYATAGKFFSEKNKMTADYYIDNFLDTIGKWHDEMKIPNLGKFHIKENDLQKIVEFSDNKNNPIKLEKDELMEVLSGSI